MTPAPLKKINYLLAVVIAIGLTACQGIQPYNGKTGYRLESGSQTDVSQPIIVSYTLASKASAATVQQKLQRACTKVLGLAPTTPVQLTILGQQEILNPAAQNNSNGNGNGSETAAQVAFGQHQHAAFGLSSTPRLSNNSNSATVAQLDNHAGTLKRVTATCSR